MPEQEETPDMISAEGFRRREMTAKGRRSLHHLYAWFVGLGQVGFGRLMSRQSSGIK